MTLYENRRLAAQMALCLILFYNEWQDINHVQFEKAENFLSTDNKYNFRNVFIDDIHDRHFADKVRNISREWFTSLMRHSVNKCVIKIIYTWFY